jgi:uncharacterized protein YecA (UPF0149 family)
MIKVKRNEKCKCGSQNKYKNCCLIKDREINEKKREEKKQETLNYVSSNKINTIKEILEANFINNKVIDITNILTIHNYKELQIKNFNKNIIMIAEETNNNKEVFEKRRVDINDDILLLYNGNYRLFKSSMILSYIESLKSLINSNPSQMKYQK